MYMFDRNGNEVMINDYVYFNDGEITDKIGRIKGVDHDTGELIIKGYDDKKLYERSISSVRRLPETVWSLLLLEKE